MSPKNDKYSKVLFSPYWFYSVHSLLFDPIWSNLAHLVLLRPFYPLKFYQVQFGPFSLIQFNSVYSIHIDPIQSTFVLFCPLWSFSIHSVYLGPIWSTLVLFGPFCPLSTSVLFGSLWSYLVHFVHFCSIRSIRPLQSYSVHIALIQSTLVQSVYFNPIQSIHSYLVLFSPPCSYLVHSVQFCLFGPLCSIWSNSIHSNHFDSFWSNSIYFSALT